MATTVGDLKSLIAVYMGMTSTSALTVNGFDIGLFALNAARRTAERAHDFKYSESNAMLSIPSTGASLSNTTGNGSATISGSVSPDVTGTYTQQGVFNGHPVYMLVAMAFYVLWYDTSLTSWVITTAGDFGNGTFGPDYFSLLSSAQDPSGNYSANGANTGFPVVTTIVATSVKRVKYVSLPIAAGDYEPIEFLTNDQFLNRVQMQTGRQAFNSGKTLANLGSTLIGNPVAYQNAQMLYLAPSNLPFPIIAQLNIVQWMPDYTGNNSADYFTNYAPEFLQWQGILEVNKYQKRFTVRQEGDVDEDHVKMMADLALQSLIAWDSGIEDGTTERKAPQKAA